MTGGFEDGWGSRRWRIFLPPPWLDGSEEACEVKGPGPVYVSVYGYDDSSDYTLEIAW